jgi:hypothetical protein
MEQAVQQKTGSRAAQNQNNQGGHDILHLAQIVSTLTAAQNVRLRSFESPLASQRREPAQSPIVEKSKCFPYVVQACDGREHNWKITVRVLNDA